MTLERNCSKCKAATEEKLVPVFPSWNSPVRDPTPGPMRVCSSCLVGAMVPAIRPSTAMWEFGTVERAFWDGNSTTTTRSSIHGPNHGNGKTRNGHYFIRFMDSQCEWATVEATAYDQYIHHFKNSSVLSSPAEYYGDLLGSFGNDEDDPTYVDDFNDDFHHASTPRRLDKLFGSDDTIHSSSMVVQPLGSPVTSRDLQGLVRQSQYDGAVAKNVLSPPSAASLASSLSITTLDDSMIVDDDESPGNSPYSTPSKVSASRPIASEVYTPSPKYSQKLWTPEEDEILLSAITAQSKAASKWSNVAKAVPGRSGKQCRERYLNHLTPDIKLKNWSPVEDATIFRLYHTDGSKWSMMSKLLRGRTDNGIKNRYHHLKRRLERQMQMMPTSADIESITSHLKKSPWVGYGNEWLLKYVATQSTLPRKKLEKSDAAGYVRPACNELCARCGLVVPSLQTGSLVCKTTGWCEVCIRVSPCLSGDLLRALDDMRKLLISE